MANDMKQLNVNAKNGNFSFQVVDQEARAAAAAAQSMVQEAKNAASAAQSAAQKAQDAATAANDSVSGLQQMTGWAVTETDTAITMVITTEDGEQHTHVLSYDADGYPTEITVDGVAVPGTWTVVEASE